MALLAAGTLQHIFSKPTEQDYTFSVVKDKKRCCSVGCTSTTITVYSWTFCWFTATRTNAARKPF